MGLFKKLKKPDSEKERELREQIEAEGGLEKNDFLAMCLGAALAFLPVAILVLGLLALFIFLLM